MRPYHWRNNIVKILNLDLNDVDTQLMLVKNFIYHTRLRDIEVSFLEVKNSASGGKIIKVYFTTESNAGNIESFYARVLCEESEELFPFRVVPSWEPVFASRNVDNRLKLVFHWLKHTFLPWFHHRVRVFSPVDTVYRKE